MVPSRTVICNIFFIVLDKYVSNSTVGWYIYKWYPVTKLNEWVRTDYFPSSQKVGQTYYMNKNKKNSHKTSHLNILALKNGLLYKKLLNLKFNLIYAEQKVRYVYI